MDSSKPLNIGVILFPTFQALDAFGPLDALNILSTKTPLNLFILAETLDPVSTAHTNAVNSPFNSNFGQSVVPTHTFSTAPPLDVLLIPGGKGRRDASTIASVSTFVKERYPSLKYVLTVCTGAFLISQAGILDGKRATTNKSAWSDTKELGPKTHWIAKARWVVDGNIWTAAGVSAGIDVALAWIGAVWGEQMAEEVALIMEYSRALDSSADPFADKWPIADVIPQS